MKISQRIELLQKEYFGEPKEIDRGHFLWEEFLVFLGVDEKCKKLDGSDAELLRRAYEIAVNLSRRFTTRERGESLGSMFTRFWASVQLVKTARKCPRQRFRRRWRTSSPPIGKKQN
jgi:hypothetical protein